MNTTYANQFQETVVRLVKSFPRDAEFPLAKSIPIPSREETALLNEIENCVFTSHSDISCADVGLTVLNCYSLVMFSVRMAVCAIHVSDRQVLRSGLTAIAIDEDQVDYRDILRALSLIEYCAKKLHIDFFNELRRVATIATTARSEILQNYMQLDPMWRTIRTMGFKATGENSTLSFDNSH
jgi:hypothetical protein